MPESSRHLIIRDMNCRIGAEFLLRNINLDSAPEHCTALVGANGSGKTTLLKVCHGLLMPASGTVCWGDKSPMDMGRRIAMVFQKPCLLRRSVRANMEYVLALYGVRQSEYEHKVLSALSMAGLENKLDWDARLLSGGEQQRLALARAWVSNPDIMLLDEPTAGLDLRSLKQVEEVIAEFIRRGMKVVFASHNLSQVKRLANDLIFLHQGECVTHCEVDDFFGSPQAEEVCEFMRLQAFF